MTPIRYAEWLKEQLELHRINAKALADGLKVSRSTITRLLKGERFASRELRQRIEARLEKIRRVDELVARGIDLRNKLDRLEALLVSNVLGWLRREQTPGEGRARVRVLDRGRKVARLRQQLALSDRELQRLWRSGVEGTNT